MDPAWFQVALKWWLGVDTSPHLWCPHCPDHQLDSLGHHALMCRGGGDAVLRHNSLRDVVAQFCHRARLGGQLEVGGGTEADGSRSRPADYLVPNWSTGKPAAFDITVTSPLNPISLPDAKVTGGSAARMAEVCKHIFNDPKCRQGLGVGLHSTGCRDLWVLGNRSQGLLSSSSLAGLTVTLQQVQSLGQHLPTTQPHFGSLRSQGLTFTCRHPDPRGLKTLV
eukprot:Em0015g950a